MSRAILTSPAAIRWLFALANVAVAAALITLAIGGSSFHAELIRTMALCAVALATYAWVLYPFGASVVVNLAMLICVAWAWASGRAGSLQLELLAFGVLLAVALWRQQQRLRQARRLEQALDDVAEERRVKEQAIALASQERDALQRKLSRYVQLQSIAEELSNLTDVTTIATLAVDRAFALIGKSDVCLLYLVDHEKQELSLFTSKKREPIATVRTKLGDQFDRYVLRTHRPLLVNDTRRDFRFTASVSPGRAVSSVVACPLLLGQHPEGVLRLDSAQPGAYTQDDLRFLDILLDLVGAAMTNARLFARTQQLAMTDGLTGLMLRRPFLEQLTRELVRSGRSRDPLAVLMVDVDHFKQYNDTFGHTVGDRVLTSIAQTLQRAVPPGGLIARYGGEEFAVLLPRLTRHEAAEVAEGIRKLVAQPVPVEDGEPARHPRAGTAAPAAAERTVTVSVGVATFPDDAQAELELIRVADQRLYQAKRSGRNLVCSS